LEKKIENLEKSLKGKYSLLSIAEGSLAEARLQSEKQSIQVSDQDTRIERLSKELEKTKQLCKTTQAGSIMNLKL
jgi:hypothetical protein